MPKKKLARVDLIWSSDLAYVVGLLTTDGSLSKDGRHIQMTSTDRQLLRTFCNCLKIVNKIGLNPKGGFTKNKQVYRVQFGNVVMYEWLKRIGLTCNKSLSLGELNIERTYFRDFLRGHLDGDGSVVQYLDRYNSKINPKYVYKRLFVFFISASERHIKWLRDEIKNLTGLNGSVRGQKLKNSLNTLYKIKYSTREAVVLLNWIYYDKNLPCLRRKYKLAKPYLNMV